MNFKTYGGVIGVLGLGLAIGTSYGAGLPRVAAQVVAACHDPFTVKGGASYLGTQYVVKRFTSNPSAQPLLPLKTGNTLYVAHIMIANHGITNYRYTVNDLTLQDDQGNTYEFRNNQYLPQVMVAGTLAPGQGIVGDIDYEAPLHKRFHFLWQPGGSYAHPFIVVPIPNQ